MKPQVNIQELATLKPKAVFDQTPSLVQSNKLRSQVTQFHMQHETCNLLLSHIRPLTVPITPQTFAKITALHVWPGNVS